MVARADIVAEALTWLGTPYLPEARVKGAGVDCAMIAAEVYETVGAIPHLDFDHYSPQWHLHNKSEAYLDHVLAHAEEIPGPPEPGDMVLWFVGKSWAHGAIVVAWPRVVHASAEARQVALADASRDVLHKKRLADRQPRYFRLRGVA